MIIQKDGTSNFVCLSENQVYTSVTLTYVLGKE